MTRLPADWPNHAISRFVRAGGIEWHVQETGAGPVLLLIHGTGAATHSWRDMLPLAARDYRVIAMDLPGHGFTSGRPRGGLSMQGVAGAVATLIAEIGAAPALIVGHSAGTAIALRMMIDGHVDPLAVVGLAPALLPFPGIAKLLFPTMAKLLFVNPLAPHIFAQVARQRGAVEGFLDRSTGSKIDAVGLAAYARLFGTPAHCAGALGMMAAWDLDALQRDLPRVARPVLLLAGVRDTAVPVASIRSAATHIEGATVEVVSGAGHLLHEEHPEDVWQRISAFAAAHLQEA